MVRARLGITEKEMRSLIAMGVIQATKQNDGNYALYPEAHVQTLLNRQADGSLFQNDRMERRDAGRSDGAIDASYTAEEAVQVFQLLEAEKPVHLIVIETGLYPHVVRRIKLDYDELDGSITIPKVIVDQMNKLTRLSGVFPIRSATDILNLMKNAAEDRTCPACNKMASADICVPCMRARLSPPRPPPQPEATVADVQKGV